MELREVRIEDSAEPGRARLRGIVQYETGDRAAEEYWFAVPARHAPALSASGNCWLACLLPLAATLGEPLRIPLPVDGALLSNAERLLRIWRAWYPHLSVVTVAADIAEPAAPSASARGAAFFSGGVDSFFTILRDRETAPPAERRPIAELIVVHGFDIPLDRPAAFQRLYARLARVADALGHDLLDVATNLRSTRWSAAQWSYLAHGAGLAAVALALESRFHTVYIAGGGGYRGLHPWGSHSVTDPLFSTAGTAIVYDAVAYLRTEKIERIADSPLVHDALHVCYELEADANCGVCHKCLRTMLTLDICGTLGRCATFAGDSFDLEQISRMDCSHFADAREFEDIRRFAVTRDRLDAVRAIDRSVTSTRRRMRLRNGLRWVRRIPDRLRGRPA
jgi:hypothetical protein